MGHPTSPTERFERKLETARESLSSTRDQYARLEATEPVPEWIIEAIGDYDRELDELDQNLEVSDEDLDLAERTARRVEILRAVLDAFRDRQRSIAEADVERVRRMLAVLESSIDRQEVDAAVESTVDELHRKCSMLDKLLDNGRYGQVLGNERFSPVTLEDSLRELDDELGTELPASAHARVHVEMIEALLEDVHGYLSTLGDRNDDRTAYGDDLREIKSRLSDAERELTDGDSNEPAEGDTTTVDETVWVLLDECIDVHHGVARAAADQQLTAALADAVRETGVSVDCDVDSCVVRGDRTSLLNEFEAVIGAGVERSTATRLARLLAQHDGSVVRTAEATEFDVDAIVDHLPRLYHDGTIADITVTIDR
jgi:hypothetical protein